MDAEFAASLRQRLQLGHRYPSADFCLRRERGIDQRLLRRCHPVVKRRRADEPQLHGDFERIVKAWINLFHLRAEFSQFLRRFAHGSRYRWMHILHIAEGRAEGDAQTANAIVQTHRVITWIERQRRPVARIGP